ncbi:probable LRR receptor-like serine/threonine-protein kinase At1g56140 isoform X3 [Pyrus x bretschneideri]|uniref:probable LRR receptor-like serine/threonine-protein kinase At1g56140 isoform X3 n=1 Tax=Pyrus x bretschneideri TaxID=225117 RepID=UPI00202EA75C|nr:probable LRR receptor-like serine/threonine-protein kinase At1g56140 isoform X3 [Pyrus x bretschneideri]
MVCFLHAMHDSASRNTSVGRLSSRRRGEQILHMYNMKIKLMMRILLLCFLSCFWFQLSFARKATTDPSEASRNTSVGRLSSRRRGEQVLHMYNMKIKLMMRILLLCFLSCFWFQLSFAQNGTTDPSEASRNTSVGRLSSRRLGEQVLHMYNMKIKLMMRILLLCFLSCFWFQLSFAQNATTDPSEVSALNSIFEQWDTQAMPGQWNISGEPCSGSAIDGTDIYGDNNNPGIVCNCSYDNGTTCHITKLQVYALNKRGVFLKEFVALRYLTSLNISKNYFTGPLRAFIGHMSALTELYIPFNSFSGPIPKELGNLKELTQLDIRSNNFSGTLPPELGNLVKLEQLWASDNPFSGKIPDFIGNWTQLTSLRFQGNSFEGPIPTSFSQLISLESLRINDIYNGSSSLDFIKNMKNLTELTLRNALITGTILSDIGEYQSLQTLDLSFNNLTGQLPSSLFNLSSLTSLFLGNNSLSGSLPSQMPGQLETIDLSYNFLSGSFPEWEDKISQLSQLNLVVNNFTFDSSNITSTVTGLNCLQRNFPCNRNTPRYANFSINCGGPQMKGRDGILYESDYSILGPTTFRVSSTENWAVSNVGSFSDGDNPPASVHKTLAQVTGTDVTPALYQTSRMSTGSLRYYGLGLVNGPYTVTLHFAETVYESQNLYAWQSLGRRVFDIYIQGTRRMKDFDISKEAGGVNRAVVRKFNVNVSENYLEIHLFWAGKGTCCPLIAAIHATSDFTKKSKTGLTVGIAVLVGVVSLLLIFAILYMRRKKSEKEDDEDILGLGPRPYTFSYAELRAATEDFNPSNKLGEGGYGPVYKGTLSDGRVVAVKQLSVSSHQGKRQFVSEIATISAVQHRNLVKLYGCCIEGSHHILVYEYLENKSLDQALFGTSNLHLDWPTRFNILLGTARGLAYLHEESRPRVVHRDVKASNILLDAELSPKISDFGLAKLYDDKKTHISTRVAGTIGYLAPEYALFGHLTEKADVFGFGVVVLEILSGRPNSYNNLDPEKIYLLEWVWTLHENDQTLGLVDPRLTEFDETEATRLIRVALMCTQGSPMARPSMSRVVAMLFGDIDIGMGTVILKPSYLTDYDYKDVTTSLTSRFLVEDDTPSTSSKGSNVRLNYQSGGSNASGVSVNVTQITAS